MGFKSITSNNSWNETHANNKKIIVENGLGKDGALSFSMDKSFRNYLNFKNINYTKDQITQEFIDEYFESKKSENLTADNNSLVCTQCGTKLGPNSSFCANCGTKVENSDNTTNVTKLDGKVIDSKVKELCGGFTGNDFFENRLKDHYLSTTEPNINYKDILKAELENNTLSLDLAEQRLDELMELDVATLNRKVRIKGMDTSSFKTQEDLNAYMGPKYAQKQMKNQAKEMETKRKRKEKLDQ